MIKEYPIEISNLTIFSFQYRIKLLNLSILEFQKGSNKPSVNLLIIHIYKLMKCGQEQEQYSIAHLKYSKDLGSMSLLMNGQLEFFYINLQ